MNRRRIAALVRLELADIRRSHWLVACAALYALLAALFLVIGLRESTVVGFTGTGRVLASLGHALVLLLPLLALTGTAVVVNRAREGGALEVLFSQPITRDDYFVAVTLVRLGVLALPLFVLLPSLAIGGGVAFDQPVPWAFLVRALAISAALLWTFVGVGLAVSTSVREPARAMVYLLLIWAAAVALLDFALVGAMLQWRLRPDAIFAIAAVNPVEAARLGLLSGAEPALDTLGPVGLFLAQRIGASGLFAVGVLWPAAVGTIAWAIARRRLRAADVV
jgi:ABC-type transport system involved in multi-copper enzyme maturation permease subunit